MQSNDCSKMHVMTNANKILEENKLLKEKVLRLQQENDFFREKFKLAQHRKFGASSEKTPDQLDWLFNEAERGAPIKY